MCGIMGTVEGALMLTVMDQCAYWWEDTMHFMANHDDFLYPISDNSFVEHDPKAQWPPSFIFKGCIPPSLLPLSATCMLLFNIYKG